MGLQMLLGMCSVRSDSPVASMYGAKNLKIYNLKRPKLMPTVQFRQIGPCCIVASTAFIPTNSGRLAAGY